jgi:hypothetical protein
MRPPCEAATLRDARAPPLDGSHQAQPRSINKDLNSGFQPRARAAFAGARLFFASHFEQNSKVVFARASLQSRPPLCKRSSRYGSRMWQRQVIHKLLERAA